MATASPILHAVRAVSSFRLTCEQHASAFKVINPNAKTPAMQDSDINVFADNAMLLYLGGKTGQFLPANTPAALTKAFLP